MPSNNRDTRVEVSGLPVFEPDMLHPHLPSILTTAGVGLWVINTALQTVFVNDCMSSFLNCSAADIRQRPIEDFLFNDGNYDESILSKLKQSDTPTHCRYKLPNGSERWLKASIIIIQAGAADTRGTFFIAVHTDAPPPGAEHDLKGAEGRRILDSLKDYAVITVDEQRTILSWNTGARTMFGYSEEEIVGKCADVIFTAEDIAEPVPEVEVNTALQTGHCYDDRWHLRKDGVRIFASGVMARLDNDGTPQKFIKIARDWTENKKMEELLRHADKHKNQFLATLAHELRNPLASILSGIEVLKVDKDKTIIVKTREIIERQVQQMIHLVNDLLDIARISLGKIKIKKELINLMDAIHLALETSRPIIEGYKHALTISLPSGPIVVYGDMIRLSQVFMNLLINSAKYTPQKGTITLVVYPENKDVLIKITDNGMGIPPQMLSSIFQMFEQIQDVSEYPQAGLGIGLSVVKQLVEMHAGTVQAYSDGANKGSEFVVRLPIVPDEPIMFEVTENLLGVPMKKEVKLSKKRLLLVDDNTDAADMLEILLKKKGYTIQKAYDGETAIQTATDFDPEIILLDIGLPDINGFEVLKRLKKLLGQRHYIALSGWGQQEDLRRSKEAGFDYHLVKPLDINSLEEVLLKLN